MHALPHYLTIRQEYGGRPATGAFLGSTWADGASEESVRLQDKGDIALQEMLSVAVKDEKGAPVGGARVVISDSTCREVFSDVTPSERAEAMLVSRGPALAVATPPQKDAKGSIETIVLEKGQLKAILTKHIVTSAGKASKTPHRVTVAKDGYQEASQAVTVDGPKTVEIPLTKLK
jgi:phage-related tail fiber protein